MSSGRKALRQNTRERVISSDWNRQQSFTAGWVNEAMRRQMLSPQDDSLFVGTTFNAPGALTNAFDVLVPNAPDYAGILNGLMVIVPAAATYVLVTSGMLIVVDPEGMVGSSDPLPLSPDDGPGPARVVASEGVAVVGALPWIPNPGPGTRVDIVEVQRTNIVSETDNRDIFNPSTGLFSPLAVTKVTVGELTYRIRQGVAGGGLPAAALGWVPLAVIAAAAGSVSLDPCTVWDVRPLLSDLANPYAQVRSIFPTVDRYQMVCENKSAPGQLRLSGESLCTYLGWKNGGIFAELGIASFINLLNAPFYQAAGFAPVAGLPYYVYALWPGGFVRWVRYYPTPVPGLGGRGPGSFRGVITVSQTPPLNGQPSIPIATPPAWGLLTSTIFGQAVVSGQCSAIGALTGFVADGERVNHVHENPILVAPFAIITPAAASSAVEFVLVPGLHFPAGTRRIRVEIDVAYVGFLAPCLHKLTEVADMSTTLGGKLAFLGAHTRSLAIPAYTHIDGNMWDIPVANDGISTPPPLGFQFVYERTLVFPTPAADIAVISAAALTVVGWDL